MTGMRFDSPSEWNGPHWAAPEYTERLAVHIIYRRNTDDAVPLISQLMSGAISTIEYDERKKR